MKLLYGCAEGLSMEWTVYAVQYWYIYSALDSSTMDSKHWYSVCIFGACDCVFFIAMQVAKQIYDLWQASITASIIHVL